MRMFADSFEDMSVSGFNDCYPTRLERKKIDVSLGWLGKILGKHIPNDEISQILGRLGFDVGFSDDIMHVMAPTWRSTGDVSIPNDILEEIARMHGFENFDPAPIPTLLTGAINQPEIDIDRKLREYLAFRCGMNEIYTYPWINDNYLNAILQNSDGMLSLSAPPAPDERFLRSSLLPNICKAVSDNLRYCDEFRIFESAQVFSDADYSAPYDRRELLPLQRRYVAGAFVGGPDSVDTLFRTAKGVIDALPGYVHIEPTAFDSLEKPIWADNVVWLNIVFDGMRVGNLALLSKKASLDCGIRSNAVILFDLDIDSLRPYKSRTNSFTRLPEYPMTDYDVSMLCDLSVRWDDIYEVILSKKGPDDLLRSVSFVDEYRGRQVPDGKKSVTFRLVIGSLDKTLTSDEIENCANAVIKRLNKPLSMELRG